MNQHLRIAAVVAAALAVVAVVALWWAPWRSDAGGDARSAGTGGASSALATATVAAAPAAARAGQATGQRYDLRYRLHFDGPAPGAGRSALALELSGTLELGPRPGDAAPTTDRVARLTGARLALDDAARATLRFPAQGAEAELERPFAFAVDAEGRVGDVRVAASASAATGGLWAQVCAATQVVRPAGAAAASWDAIERNTNGAYRTTYTRGADGALAKSAVATPGQRLPGVERPSGQDMRVSADFSFDGASLRSLHYTEEGAIGMGKRAGTPEQALYRVELTLQARGPASLAWADPAHLRGLTTFDARAAAASARAPQSNATLAELMAAAQIAAAGGNPGDRATVADELARKLRIDPALVGEVAGKLRGGVGHDGVELALVEALVRADSAPAQRALTEMAADAAVARPLRERVLAGGVFVPHPTATFRSDLSSMAYAREDGAFAGMAAITLGAALQRAARDEAQAAAAAADAARMAAHTQALLHGDTAGGTTAAASAPPAPAAHADDPLAGPGASASVGQIRRWITALGNTGLPQARPVLLTALRDPRERLRVAAALALRWQDAALVAAPMAEAMREDDSIHVRDNLLRAARYLGPEHLLTLVRKALFSDRSEWVRSSAAHTMTVWALEAPGLRADLEQALAAEASPKVRETLRNFLEPGRVSAPFERVVEGEVAP